MSDSLRPHKPQHARPPCPSPTPRVYSNSCPVSQWCHPTIASSVIPFSSCLQSFPPSGSLQMSKLFASGGQSIGVSASASVLPMDIQDWFPLGWTSWISLHSKGLSRVFSNTIKSINSSVVSFLYSPTLTSIHDYQKNHSFDYVLPREHTSHSKHPLPTAQEKTLHMDITRWSTLKSDWLYSLQPKMEKFYTVSKNKTRSCLWLRSWTPYCQIQT